MRNNSIYRISFYPPYILFVLMLTNVGDLTKLCKFATKYFTC